MLMIKNKKRKYVASCSILILISAIGVHTLISSHAATPYAIVTADSGTLGGSATKSTCNGADDGSCVVFDSAVNNDPMGISTGTWEFTFQGLSATAQQAQINTMKADGVKWLRVDVDSNNGDVDIVKDAEANGINIDALMEASGGTTTTPSSMAALAKSEVPLLKSYGVNTFEVLNEPNGCGYRLTAAAYTAILQSTYPEIKAADPNSTVLAAGLCPNSGSNEPYTYITAMYQAGAKGYFDDLNDHAYSIPDTPLQTSDSWNPWSYLTEIHNIMVANGDGNKKIWITEFGCPTGSLDDGFPAECTDASLAQQITDAHAQQENMTYLGPLFIYDWQDGVDDFGLYNSDGSPKPDSVAAFKAAAG
jgi:hypothetical protein